MDYKEVADFTKKPELKKLLDLPGIPKHLYYSGKWDPQIFTNCVAVVGSRKLTTYGERVIDKLIPILISQNKTIVSGFMYGVDQYVHSVCVRNGGKTIAVLGWGITTQLSGYDFKLASEIIDNGGLLISEWEEQKPALWTFPARNRIVAALSESVYVIEAALQSGSLITAKLANKLHRELWAVPGPITSLISAGTNKLIAEGKAKMWLGETISLPKTNTNDPILKLLENESLSADELCLRLKIPVSEIGARLTMYLLQGQVCEKEGRYYLDYVS